MTATPDDPYEGRRGGTVGAARKQAGIVVPEASGVGLARWSSRTGRFTAESAIPAVFERPHAVE